METTHAARAGRGMTALRRTSGIIAAVTLTTSLAACAGGAIGGGTEGGDDVFKVGLISPVTGPVVQEATAMQRGFELAIEKINAEGGVLGQPVEVVTVDDQADAAKSTQLAQRLISQDQVDYIFGTIPGDTTAAVAQVAESAKVPFSSAILGNAGVCGQYFFPFGEPNASLLNGLLPQMIADHGTKVALVGNDYAFPRGYFADARTVLEELGATVVLEEYSPMGTADWQPVISKIKAAAPDWVLTAVVGADATALVTQADQAGILDSMGFTGVSLIADFYPGLTDRMHGLTLVGRYSDQLDNEANKEFVDAFREAYDFSDPIPSVAANAYEGMLMIADAVEQAGSTEGADIAKALGEGEVENGVFGGGSFNEDRFFMTETARFEIREGGAYVPVETFPADIEGITPRCA
ncbi:ABC transporter substrate-binding protein [Salinibacterium sp. SYSU T00001]|uniref:ABC transporter substrate-binding protein n=1 Tax=Homoserinimonas sedimenticola TaxID=2986805 RepID=UPI0022358078|nr:ABC transporter substrate-binding protein [Salinibacterium sedimenticola]MCW4385645.1 ABC transporter substrate-binding protein [Salinibacterium sedimenticola]